MKFKINEFSPIYAPLNEMYDWAIMCQDKALGWCVTNLGQPQRFWPEERVLFGSIGAVQFNGKKPKPKEWRRTSAANRIYVPKAQHIIDSLATLPRVTNEQFQKIIGYAKFYPTADGINHVPGLAKGENYFLINVPDGVRGYEPLEGMEEILGSEYNRLLDAAEAWRIAGNKSEEE